MVLKLYQSGEISQNLVTLIFTDRTSASFFILKFMQFNEEGWRREVEAVAT